VESETPDAAPVASGRKPIRHWLLEGIFIAVSVVLGFAVSQYGEYRNERQLARQMLESIRSEVEFNRTALEPYLPFHRAWRDQLMKADSRNVSSNGLDFLFSVRPPMRPDMRANVPFLRHAAWDTATSTGALRLIDYDLAAGLSEIYSLQQYAATTFASLFGQSAFYDPAAGVATARLAQTMMQEMTWTEELLLGLYDKQLPILRSASGSR
jgi:hypothetical protein